MIVPIFPDDFDMVDHPCSYSKWFPKEVPLPYDMFSNAKQWTWDNGLPGCQISVVGGPYFYGGDGRKTFEFYDSREAGPRLRMTKEQINEHLKANPF